MGQEGGRFLLYFQQGMIEFLGNCYLPHFTSKLPSSFFSFLFLILYLGLFYIGVWWWYLLDFGFLGLRLFSCYCCISCS